MYTFFSYIKDNIDDNQVFNKLTENIEQKSYIRYHYPDFNIENLKYLIFREDSSGALTISKYLQGLNIPTTNILLCNKVEDFFRCVKGLDYDVLMLWYGPSETSCISVLYELFDTRDVVFVPSIVFCAGEDSYKAFLAQGSHLHVDVLQEFPKLRANIKLAIEKCINNFYAKDSFAQALNNIRLHVKYLIKHKVALFNENILNNYFEVIYRHYQKRVWGDIEQTYLAMFEKNIDKALELSKNIVQNVPKILGAQVLYFTALARKYNDVNTAVKHLVMHIRQRKDITVEKLYKVATIFIRWKNTEGLEQILEYWYKNNQLLKNDEFDYVLGNYYFLKRDYENAFIFLKLAVNSNCIKEEYLESFALNLEALHRYEDAKIIWNLYLKLKKKDEIEAKKGLARCYAKLNEKEKYQEILNEIKEKYNISFDKF